MPNNYAVTTLNFAAFNSQLANLRTKGFRSFGPSAGDLAKDVEPEYVTISRDGRTAWVTLQENNAIARVDLSNKTITDIWPLGYKHFYQTENASDMNDQDGTVRWKTSPVFGLFQPDAIAVIEKNGTPYLFTGCTRRSALHSCSQSACAKKPSDREQ